MTKKTPSIGSRVRSKLADITNSKTMRAHIEDERSSETLRSNKDVVDQLVKENMALIKHVLERNTIIDLSEAEIKKLRGSIQKLQLQNWHLAQSNSCFLAEINFGRNKIKSLEHEIECKEALLKAKCLNGKAEMNHGNSEWQEGEKPTEQFSLTAKTDIKASNGNRKPPGRARSQSMGPSTSYSTVADKEKVVNKRHCVRRQSGRFKYQMRQREDNLFEIEDMKFSAAEEQQRKNNGISSSSSSRLVEEASVQQRSSIGRAPEKISILRSNFVSTLKSDHKNDEPDQYTVISASS